MNTTQQLLLRKQLNLERITMTTQSIIIKLTQAQFTGLKTTLNGVMSNIGYFPRKALKTAATKEGSTVVLTLNLEQYTNFKNALAAVDHKADAFLDILFTQGEETAQNIVNEMNAQRENDMRASAEAQTGLKDLKVVTNKDLKKAKAATKPKIKVKAGSRKA